MKKAELHGVCAAMCTPFDASGEKLDEARYKDHIDDLLAAGVHGVVLCSGTGEFPYLRDEEKTKLIEIGVKQVKGRVPTIAQTTALSTSEAVEKARAAEALGADALMVLPPYLEAPGERGILYHYEKIARAVSLPIVMYNVPEQSGVDITPDLYRKLISFENLEYIKDSSADLIRIQQYNAIGGKVLNGADPIAPFGFMSGCPGMIWGAANVMPHETVELYSLIKRGKHADALVLWTVMRPLCIFLWANSFDTSYLVATKEAARLVGRDLGPPRKPLPPMSGPARTALRLALANLPTNSVRSDRLVWRDWLDEREWLNQSYLRA